MSDPRRMDDTDFMRHVLADGDWHGQMEIIGRSVEIRGHGLTPHSRASSLRKLGFVVENRQHMENGRRVSEYRLLGGSAEFPPRSLAGPPSRTVRKGEDNQDGRVLAGGPPSYGPPSGSGPDPISPVEGPAQQSLWAAA